MDIKLNTRIRKIRVLRGYSQVFVAKKLGITQKAYSKIECGETKLNWDKLNQLAEIFEIGVWVLVNTNKELSKKEETSLDISRNNVNLLEKLLKQYESEIKGLKGMIQNLEEENQVLKIKYEAKI